jgi:Carboxypeptidase regulatory-like domain
MDSRRPSRRPAAILILACSVGFAADPATLSGTVADPTGAVIAGAVVTVRNTVSGAARQAVSGADGSYLFQALPAGRYAVEAAFPGFQPYRQPGLDLAGGTVLHINVILMVGEHIDTVVVTESPIQIDPSGTQLGQTIPASKIAAVPVNGRSYTDLLALQPGVIPVNSQQPNAVVMSGCTYTPPSGDLNPGAVSVNGQRETANGFSINGISAQEDFNMGAAIVPDLDSIQDFRVLTSNFDAEYGNFSGSQVLVTTKSGGNQWHGSAFEFARNTGLDARNFLASERARYDRNQYGATLGGPLRKDRIFFFADYQGTQTTQGIETGLITVPSLADRSGDLSDLGSSLTGKVNGQYWAGILSSRLGHTVVPGEPYYTPGCTNADQCVLPNARIAQRAWSAPAAYLLNYVPKPNQANNVFSSSAANQSLGDSKGGLRIDANTRWGSVAAYYSADDYSLDNPYPSAQGGADVPGFNAISAGRAQMITLGLTTAFGPSAVNELRLGYLRDANNIGQPAGGVGPSLASQGFVGAQGQPGIVPLAPSIQGIENVSFTDFTIGVDITGLQQANNTYQVADNFSKIAGAHSLKFGIDLHIDQVNIAPNATYNGAFLFQGTETGSDFADFLLGIASNYAQGDSNNFYLRNKYAGVFAEDSWRLRPNLTFNYGLRWDMLPPWSEKYNQIQTLAPGRQSVVYPGAPAGIVFPGDSGIPATLAPTRYTNFAPRAGIAWSPDFDGGLLGRLFGGAGKTSIRAGYGLFYTAIEGLSAGIMSACPPYGYDYDSFAPPLFQTPFVTAATGQNVGQRFPSPIPAAGASATNPNATVDWTQYLPITGMPSYSTDNVTPYTGSYSLTVERQLGRDTVLQAGYVGAQAHHLLVLTSANPGDSALCLALSDPANVAPGTATCGPFGESGTYTTRSGQIVQGTRGPFSSQFAAVTLQKTIGNSNYNALELSLRHSSGAGELMIGYTYSKSLDQSSSLAEAVNPLDANLDKALSSFDMRHNFVASYRTNLPFDRLLRRKNRWTEGWSLSGVTRFATGLPVTLFNNNDTSLLGTIPNGINDDGVDTPDYTPGNLKINTDPRDGRSEFNASLFALPALGTLGTAARRFFYGPGIENFDMALHRTIAFRETQTLELRLEAFNVFNHAQFYGQASVNGNISSAAFGTVVSAAAPREIQLAATFAF